MEFEKLLAVGGEAYKQGHYQDALDSFTAARESAPPELSSVQQVNLKYEIGRACRRVAKYKQAHENLNDALAILERQSLSQTLETAKILVELGKVNKDEADFDAADKNFNHALEIRKANLAEPHELIAEIYKFLGLVASRRGKDALAMTLCDQSIDMMKSTIGEEHEDYGEGLDNKGVLLNHIGNFDEAITLHKRAQKIREERLGMHHPEVAYSLNNLAQAMQKQQGSDKSAILNLMNRTLTIWEKAYGPDSPTVAAAVNNLGGFHLHVGSLNEAATCFERALEIKERTLGKDNPSLIKNISNLAIVYKRLNRTADAEALRKRSQALMHVKVDAEGNDVDTMILLADSLFADKQFGDAQRVLLNALVAAEKDFGKNSLKAAKVLQMLGSTNVRTDPEKAKEYYARVVRIKKLELGLKHPEITQTLRLLASCFTQQGDDTTARVLQSQAKALEFQSGFEDPQLTIMAKKLTELRQTKGSKSPEVLGTIKIVAEMYSNTGKTIEADALFEEYIAGKEELVGSDSLNLASELSFVAISNQRRHKHDSAIRLWQQALKIQEKHHGEFHKGHLLTLDRIGASYEALEDFDKAEETYLRSVSIIEKLHDSNYWTLNHPLSNLQRIEEQRGNTDKAEALAERIKNLSPVDLEEQQKLLLEATEKMTAQLTAMLGNLTAVFGNQEQDQTQTAASAQSSVKATETKS